VESRFVGCRISAPDGAGFKAEDSHVHDLAGGNEPVCAVGEALILRDEAGRDRLPPRNVRQHGAYVVQRQFDAQAGRAIRYAA